MPHSTHYGNFCKRLLVVWCVHFTAMDFLAFSQPPPCPVTWGPTVQISNTPFDAFVPQLAVVGDTVHMVYHAGAVHYRRSTDAGQTWGAQIELVSADSMSSSLGNPPIAVHGQAVSVVWSNRNASGAITSNKIRRSTDGGATWLEPQILVRNDPLMPLRLPSIAVHGDQAYVTMTRFVSSQLQYFIMVSSDGGVTWDSVRQITFVSESHGLGNICVTALGVHLVFERAAQPSGREISYMVSTDSGTTWSEETVLSTIDNYQAWEPNVAADDAGNVYVSWQDAKYGSIGGFAGTVLLRKSTDNGQTWLPEVQVSPLPSARHSSLSTDENFVHVIWDDERNGVLNGTIQYRGSADGANTWCYETTIGDTQDVETGGAVVSGRGSLYVAWSSYLWTGPPANVYFRKGEYSVVSVGERLLIPQSFIVSSAYPNPFNASTSIEYSVPYEGRLSITVYDMLGRNVASLAEGDQVPGRYLLSFNASHLASGIYYVRFQFETLTITKAVVLMR